MARKIVPPDNRDALIRKLQADLTDARWTIVGLMPDALQEILTAAIHCQSRQDVRDWETWAIDQLIELAGDRPRRDIGQRALTRAYCPLCGGSAQTANTSGFAMPTGLRRHLEGSHGSRRCGVFSAAIDPCFEQIAERSEPGYRGPNWEGLSLGLPPWKIRSPEPVQPSAQIIKFPSK